LEQLFSDEESDLGENELSDDWECWDEESELTVRDTGDAAYTTTFDAGMLTKNGLGERPYPN
jgi:hypothetical protein